MEEPAKNLTFSQRNGLSPVPPQLKLGEVSKELRNRLHYPLALDFQKHTMTNYTSSWIEDWWEDLLRDHFVLVQGNNVNLWDSKAYGNEKRLEAMLMTSSLGGLFDFVEFILQHPRTPPAINLAIQRAFIESRAAYRVFDGKTIGAVGTAEQAAAIERGVQDAAPLPGAASHLVNAAASIRSGDWAASVRESIHAVESVAVQLAPSKDTLGDALAVLNAQQHIHGGLKKAFSMLYGYTSDEEGVRHALVLRDGAAVDEADALFMLGACASFVSYLVAKARAGGLLVEGAHG